MKSAFIASAIVRVACALVDPAPSVTDSVAMKELGLQRGFSPKPTTAPIHRDLRKRQAGTSILGYLAPDNTCGYVDGRIGGVKTCDTSENCAAVLGDDDFYTMACCGAGMCTLLGQCYDYASMSACDHACEQDANIVKCSSAAYPYCYGYSVPGMSMGFYSCDSTSAATFDIFETTYDGEVGAQTWLALQQSDVSSLLSSSIPDTTTERSGAATIGVTTTPIGSKGAASTTSAPTQVIEKESKKSTPVGSSVVGTVGGVAALCAIVGAIIFFLLRKKKKSSSTAAAAAGNDPNMSQPAAPNVPPTGPTYSQAYAPPAGAGNPTSGYFAPAPAKMDGSEAKYDQNGIIVAESQVPAVTPISPAPAYSASFAGPPPPQMLSDSAASPPLPMDNRFSVPPPPAGYAPQPQPGYPPAQQPAAPVELGNTYAVPLQYQGRPVYEAA